MAVTTHFNFETHSVPIRDDLSGAFRQAWEHIAKPGCWWSGAERVAIAEEYRNARECSLCLARKAAVTPNAVQGEHDNLGVLSNAAVEVVHRIGTDPGRLSKTWYDKTLDLGLSDGQYVELVGVLVTVNSIDAFHRALGIPPEALPSPQAGEASGYRPEGTALSGGWVPMIVDKDVAEAEADLFETPNVGNVTRALSLVPDELRNMHALSTAMYLKVTDIADFGASGGRAITRPQMELLAARVSALNECFY